jgi:hypothetical protein
MGVIVWGMDSEHITGLVSRGHGPSSCKKLGKSEDDKSVSKYFFSGGQVIANKF